METSRFFITNLYSNTTEQDLRRLFQDYGEVTRVELKTKKNLVDEEDVQLIAFVTLKLGADDAQYCLNELNWQKINGAKIKVSLAKESFLERLKREREEAGAAAADLKSFNEDDENASELLKGTASNTRKKFAEDEEFNEDDISPDLLITKKRASNSMHNGKIVIQSYDISPIHVIETKKATPKQLAGKSLSADQKRKESLMKMKQQYQQQKSTIQQSLAGMDTSHSAKKIKFSDAEEEEQDSNATIKKSKTNIFGSDDERDGDELCSTNLNLKSELFGKKGEKLLQMQSKQSSDPRFKLNPKFVDDEAEGQDNSEELTTGIADGENERDWQIGILEQVVGTKIDTATVAQKAAKNKKMLRFDPANKEHQKYLRGNKSVKLEEDLRASKKSAFPNSQHTIEEIEEGNRTPLNNEVSKELFYTVSDTLTQSLKTRGDGFSLLNMFGQDQQLEQRELKLQKVSNEKILVNKMDKNVLNPFSYDSSSESDNELQNNVKQEVNAATQNKGKSKVSVVLESFFIPKNDARLKEGAKFFKYEKKDDVEQSYEEVRNRLKLLIKTKITKSKKNLASAGVKVGKNKVR